MARLSPLAALLGPTASAKSAIALLLAERFDAAIVSVDSMQVYRGMDIGTAKPSAADRRRVPHHLIDLVDPAEAFSVADFQRTGRTVLDQAERAGARLIVVGGSG
ncbi:MAG TPA: isopentenyl transferase family protein, partial [Acidimicrobiia bacterium]|nr:isopentenyl transferase family protein [Acidimicrobiia bacterium]